MDGLDLRPFVLKAESLGTAFSPSVDIGPALFYSRRQGQNLDQAFVLVNLETHTGLKQIYIIDEKQLCKRRHVNLAAQKS